MHPAAPTDLTWAEATSLAEAIRTRQLSPVELIEATLRRAEKLQPRRLYERQGRAEQYARFVEDLKADRVRHLQQFTQLSEDIIKAVG